MKIDVKSIENYAKMTAEEKIAYFENLEIDTKEDEVTKLTSDLERYKRAVTNANAEAKKYKDERNAHMSEEERLKQSNQEAIDAMKNELETLRKDNRISDTSNWLISSLGMDAELSKQTAEAFENGDVATYRANLAQHQVNIRKQVEMDLLKNQPSLSGGSTPTKEQLENAQFETIFKGAGII